MRLLRSHLHAGSLAVAALGLAVIAVASLSIPGAQAAARRRAHRWVPPQHLTWYWQLQGHIRHERVAAYDIDGFETPASEVASLHAEGRHVVCYLDVGTWERWRPDASRFPRSVLGRSNGWPGERWLDIRRLRILKPIMRRRLHMCARKGFDAVEPDNIEGYANRTGFPVTAGQQIVYDRWIAKTAHSLHLAVFQKNDAAQTGRLHAFFDGALTEQCHQFGECGEYRPYLREGKPVVDAEYALPRSRFCAADRRSGVMGVRFSLALDGTRFQPCWRR